MLQLLILLKSKGGNVKDVAVARIVGVLPGRVSQPILVIVNFYCKISDCGGKDLRHSGQRADVHLIFGFSGQLR